MLVGHSGCSLWTFPTVSTVRDLRFNIASVSASSILSDSSFNDLPCVFKRQQNIPYWPYLSLPNSSHVTGCWWVSTASDVICINNLERVLNFLMIHLFKGICKFFLCSNKIGPIVTGQNSDVPSSSSTELVWMNLHPCYVYFQCALPY